MADNSPVSPRPSPLHYALGYLLWLVSIGLTILDILYGRILLGRLAEVLTGANHWMLSFLDRAGMLVLGAIGLSLVLFFEYHYRTGVEQNCLWTRFAKITALQAAILAAGLLAVML